MKIYLILSLIFGLMFSKELSETKIKRLSQKGSKLVKVFCKNLSKIDSKKSLEEIIKEIKTSKACTLTDPKKLEAIGIFLKFGSSKNLTQLYKEVPKDAKCPVCGMFVYKYPKWAAKMVVENKSYFFDGVKDMMKFYFFDGDFPYDRSKITKMVVSDFYTLQPIDAKKAFYVIGSNLYGPMGNELIPFKDKNSAKAFMQDHKGEKIIRFQEITPKMVMALDGIKME